MSNLAVVSGGSTRNGLHPGALGLLLLAVVGLSALLGKRDWLERYLRSSEEPPPTVAAPFSGRARLLLLLAVPSATALWFATRSLVAVWLAALVVYGGAIIIGYLLPAASSADVAEPQAQPITRRDMRVVHGLALSCALFTLLSIRPRTDDAFYLSMSVSVVDYPDAPLLHARTLHGPPTETLAFQAMFPPYKVHSFETLGGYLAYLTGLDVTAVVHFGLTNLFAWLTPYALARLLRWLMPRGWLLALVAMLSYYVIDGTAGRGFANQAFVRMFNGKAVMLTVGVPLLLYYGLRLGVRPTAARFVLALLAQISVMGMSSTGIWLAPMLAVIAAAAGAPTLRVLPRAIGCGVLSSSYVLGMGGWVFTQLAPDRGEVVREQPSPSGAPHEVAQAFLDFAIPEVLGKERTAIGLLSVFTLACALARSVQVLRLLAGAGFVLVALLVNPWLTKLVARLVTGSITYERVFWLLPVPLAVGLATSSAREWLRNRFSTRVATLLALAALAVFYAASVDRLVISEANRAWLRFPPTLKTYPMSRTVAETVCRIAPRPNVILASEPISQQIAKIQGCGHPLMAGLRWISAPDQEKLRRVNLQRVVSVKGDVEDDDADDFRRGLGIYRVSAIAMTPQGMRNRTMKAILRSEGFRKVSIVEKHHIYVRPF